MNREDIEEENRHTCAVPACNSKSQSCLVLKLNEYMSHGQEGRDIYGEEGKGVRGYGSRQEGNGVAGW